jgi:imidazole glycerol-phosphate synthase subunit HisH
MKVTVIDYGIGNLYSVGRALERCGADVLVSDDPAAIESTSRLVLPGVGAFADGMLGLRERDLVTPIRRYAESGRPLLGICLGMQMLASVSEEFGEHQGLDLIPGRVRSVPAVDVEGRPHKIPHIGWSALRTPAGAEWQGSILENTPPGSAVYLVHSFAVVPDDPSHRLADCHYGGHAIAAAIWRGPISGCQFHPEKSGDVGLAILARFLR